MFNITQSQLEHFTWAVNSKNVEAQCENHRHLQVFERNTSAPLLILLDCLTTGS